MPGEGNGHSCCRGAEELSPLSKQQVWKELPHCSMALCSTHEQKVFRSPSKGSQGQQLVSGGNTHSTRVAELLLGMDSLSPSETLSSANGEAGPRRGNQASRAGPRDVLQWESSVCQPHIRNVCQPHVRTTALLWDTGDALEATPAPVQLSGEQPSVRSFCSREETGSRAGEVEQPLSLPRSILSETKG